MKVRGAAIMHTIEFIRKKYGDRMLNEIFVTIPTILKDELEEGHKALPQSWYSFDLYEKINRMIADKLGKGDASIIFQSAMEGGREDIERLFNKFIKDITADNMMNFLPKIYEYYYDFGKASCKKEADGMYTVIISDVDNYPIFFERCCTYFLGIIRNTGAPGAEVKFDYIEPLRKVVYTVLF